MEGSPFTGLDVDPAWYAEVQGVHRYGWGSTVVQSYIGAATHRHKPCLHILNRVTLNWIRIQIRSVHTCSCEASLAPESSLTACASVADRLDYWVASPLSAKVQS